MTRTSVENDCPVCKKYWWLTPKKCCERCKGTGRVFLTLDEWKVSMVNALEKIHGMINTERFSGVRLSPHWQSSGALADELWAIEVTARKAREGLKK